MNAARLTIGVTTRDRVQALERCLRSLEVVAHLSPEIFVFDDASVTSAADAVQAWDLRLPVTVIRDDASPGYIAGRNRLMRAASAPFVLLMDDDAALLGADAVETALKAIEGDAVIGAVAFAQCDRHGGKWDERMQPGRSPAPALVASFIGFAHLLRRDEFLRLGGYRESFEFYGEEKDYCVRLIEDGYRTLYLPDATVVHEPDQAGRSQQRYLRYVTRNDCLAAIYNEPVARLAWLLPARVALYFRMRRAWKVVDPWGWAWVLREVWRRRAELLRDRQPVSRTTLATWKRLRDRPEPYGRAAAETVAAGGES